MKNKVSIVTCSYNQGNYIEQTILSVINQDYENIEYIIVDGGSQDNTLDILDKYKKYITYYISEKDEGCADGLNKGLRLCTGDFFYYLNSDDFLCEGAITKAMDYICKNPMYDVYLAHGFEYYNGKYRAILNSDFNVSNVAAGFVSFFQQGTIFRLHNELLFNKLNTTCWDFELLVDEYLRHRRFKLMPYSYKLGVFRLHSESITGSQNLKLIYRGQRSQVLSKLKINSKIPKTLFYIKYIVTNPVYFFHKIISLVLIK